MKILKKKKKKKMNKKKLWLIDDLIRGWPAMAISISENR
jgi:hypothetical protein